MDHKEGGQDEEASASTQGDGDRQLQSIDYDAKLKLMVEACHGYLFRV